MVTLVLSICDAPVEHKKYDLPKSICRIHLVYTYIQNLVLVKQIGHQIEAKISGHCNDGTYNLLHRTHVNDNELVIFVRFN